MTRRRPSTREPGPRWLLALALALSGAAHLAFGVIVGRSFALPELDIAFQVPIDVELGMGEEIAVAPLPEPPALVEAAPEAPARAKPPKPPAERDAGPSDAGAELAESGSDARGAADAGDAARDAAAGPGWVVTDAGQPGARLPAGAQIALRVDMDRIRRSPLAEDIRGLLAAIPDWRALLDGSGIDPVNQLERLLIMTPNLQREKIALAGRYLGGRRVVDEAVQSLAQARGEDARWRAKRGVPVATWANADSTPRVIALVGPAHFTISREEDLERVLSIAAARAQKARSKGAGPEGSVADALLAMEADEGLSLEVEGVEQFVRRGRRGIPLRLRVSAIQEGEVGLILRGRLVYADETGAGEALQFWQGARDTYARNALVNLLGLGGVLKGAELSQTGSELNIALALTVDQTRLLIGYAHGLAAPPR